MSATIEWVEYTPDLEPLPTPALWVLVFEGRWCGHLPKTVREDGYRKVVTLCGLLVAQATYIMNGSHYGWDWDGPPTETWGVHNPPDEHEPPLCRRCFR